ncbi:MAG: EamA family transporter [Nocardioides sp.]
MSTMTHDGTTGRVLDLGTRQRAGLTLAVLSAASFGLSGSLAKGMVAAGWTPGSAVLVRVAVASVVLAVPTMRSLRGRWALLGRNLPMVLAYGVVVVAGCQLAYFNAAARMPVGVALLIEYTAPVPVIAWLWVRHGERPRRLTVTGALIAGVGLVLVLDLLAGTSLSGPGVAWAFGATAGAAVYFVLSAREDDALPPLALAGSGLVIGTVVLALAGVVHAVPMTFATHPPTYDGASVPWWLPVLGLGVVTAALAFVTGIAAIRRLGSRLASFVALFEVLAALVFAWLLLGELPHAIQFAGGALVLAGVVVVRIGERPAPPPTV